ncbi:MAG: hypothetical protein ACM3II_05710 [Rhodospirillaceae bacterium]
MTMPPDDRPRASRAIKLVLMGIAGAALLYSCSGAMGGGMGFWPWLWFWGNPFSRGPMVSTPSTTTSPSTTQSQPSQRGGFGSSAGEHGSTAS